MIDPYVDIIERLLTGWKPNHERGNLIQEWWHPYKPTNNLEFMSDTEFIIVRDIENKLDRDAIGEILGKD